MSTHSTISETSLPAATSAFFKSVIVVLTCTLTMIGNSANIMSTSISLTTIGKELRIQETELQWLISAYPLSSGCLLLFSGRLADLYGRKKMFLLGSSILLLSTLGCGFAKNSITLDVLRSVQGVGAAAAMPASYGILTNTFPPSRARAAAVATFSAGVPIGAGLGMAVGGLLTDVTANTWRSMFFLQAGMTASCLLGALMSINPDSPSVEVDRRIDWVGAVLVTAGIVLIVFVLGQGELAPQRWATPYIIALSIIGIFLIALFIFWQRYLEKIQKIYDGQFSAWLPPPLMKTSLWTRAKGRFAAMMSVAFLTWCAFLPRHLWVQLYYQEYLGYTPLQAVARQLPMFISGIICNVVMLFVVTRVPITYLIVIGTLSTSTACLLFALIDPSASYWAFSFPAPIAAAIGAEFVHTSGTLFISKVSQPHEQSLMGGLIQMMAQLGTAVGAAVTTVVFNRVTLMNAQENGRPTLKSYHAAQWTTFSFGMLAALLAILFFRKFGNAEQAMDDKEKEQETSRATDSGHELTMTNTNLGEP